MGTFDSEVLTTWVVEVELPPHPGFGLRKQEAPRPDGRGASAVLADQDERQAVRWAKQRERLRGHLERARRFEAMLKTGEVKNAAELSRREGVSRARVSQLMALLKLSKAVLARLEEGVVPSERELRRIARLADAEQLAEYERATSSKG